MAMNRAAKTVVRDRLAKELEGSSAALLAHYRGATAAELAALRLSLRKVGARFEVVKNRILIKALDIGSPDMEALRQQLKGPIGIVYVRDDVAAAAKVLTTFAKEVAVFEVAGGVVDGKAVRVPEVSAIADLPSREVLLAQVASALLGPHRGLVGVLAGVSTALVRTLAAIRDQKEGSSAA